MTVIVTRGAGFIGSNFIFHMLGKCPDYRIVSLDKLTLCRQPQHPDPCDGQPQLPFCKAGYL